MDHRIYSYFKVLKQHIFTISKWFEMVTEKIG